MFVYYLSVYEML